MTHTDMPLLDGNICLRRARQDDVAARMAAGNYAQIQHMYGIPKDASQPCDQDQAQGWVSTHIKNPHSWFIDIDAVLSGVIFLHSVNDTDRRATLAMGLLRPSDLGRGFGSRALRLVLHHAFTALNLHRISLRVLSYNARAIAAYRKVGFVQEGVERQSARVGDSWHDDVMMALLAPDWRAAR